MSVSKIFRNGPESGLIVRNHSFVCCKLPILSELEPIGRHTIAIEHLSNKPLKSSESHYTKNGLVTHYERSTEPS